MQQQELEQAQQASLDLIDYFHTLCEKLNLKYYIIAGTMLGAVRHRGYIPWDVDLDVGMFRPDYEKLKEYFLNNDDETVFYSHYLNNKQHNSPHAILYLKNTIFIDTRIKSTKNQSWRGLILDIFPLDNPPDDDKKKLQQAKKLNKYKKILYYKNFYTSEKNSKLKIVFKKIIHMLLKVYRYRKLLSRLDKLEQKYNSNNSSKVVSMSSGYKYQKQLFDIQVFGNPKLYQFGSKKYYGVHEYDQYLTQLYGDYMTPAPHVDLFDEYKYFIFKDNRERK